MPRRLPGSLLLLILLLTSSGCGVLSFGSRGFLSATPGTVTPERVVQHGSEVPAIRAQNAER